MARIKLRDVGKESTFSMYWPDADTDTWPARELCWVWTHPAIGFVVVLTAIWEVYLIVTRIIL